MVRKTLFALHAAALVALASAPAWAGSTCDPDGLQASGSIYRICMPDAADYNGSLVLWAHGFQDAGTPVSIPEDQLIFGNTSLPEIINALGFGFATNSYSKTGLAIRQGMDDLVDLVDIYSAAKGAPDQVLLTGASEGGIITALLIEERPDLFAAGLAACGPVGDFPYQINYFGNGRAVFEYFFPGLIPGDPFNPSPDLAQNWRDFYDTAVKPVILDPANRAAFDQLVAVARLPFDENDYLDTAENSISDVLRYAVVNLNDARDVLGGFPFDNSDRFYFGSDNDLLLNLGVPRASADPAAIEQMQQRYNTSGVLTRPLNTIHTSLDQQVPYPHEPLYFLKTLSNGSFLTRHLNFRFDRYGHCNFTLSEVLFSFILTAARAGNVDVSGVGAYLGESELARFEALAGPQGLKYRVDGPRLKMQFNPRQH